MLFANIFLYAWRMFKILKSNKKEKRKPLIRHLAERMHAELHVIYLYVYTYCLMQFTVVNQLQPDMARRQRKYVNNSV